MPRSTNATGYRGRRGRRLTLPPLSCFIPPWKTRAIPFGTTAGSWASPPTRKSTCPSSSSTACSPCSIAARRARASPTSATGRIKSYRSVGMVTNALSHYLTEDHPSRVGIGHVRYSTQGTNKLENAQPIVVSCSKGEISLAHNGNISNSEALQERAHRRRLDLPEHLRHGAAPAPDRPLAAAHLPRRAHGVPGADRGRVLLPPDARGEAVRGAGPVRVSAARDGHEGRPGAHRLGDLRAGHVPGPGHPRDRAGGDGDRGRHAGSPREMLPAAEARGGRRALHLRAHLLRPARLRSSSASRCTWRARRWARCLRAATT